MPRTICKVKDDFEDFNQLRLFLFIYSLTQNFGHIERINKMSFSKSTDNGMLQIFSF